MSYVFNRTEKKKDLGFMSGKDVRIQNRVRKVYEALKTNNKKSILKIAEQVVKEYPDSLFVKVSSCSI